MSFGVDPVIRIGLSVYLMLVTLAGPWLCCCQLPRLSARFVAMMRNDQAKPAGNNHSCCQHRVPVKDSQSPANPGDPSCPCQGTRLETPALVLESEGARQLDRDLNSQVVDLLGGDFLPGTVALSAALNLVFSTASPPFFTGRDILSALHILRC